MIFSDVGPEADEARRLALRLIAARAPGSESPYLEVMQEALRWTVTGGESEGVPRRVAALVDALTLFAQAGVHAQALFRDVDDAEILHEMELTVETMLREIEEGRGDAGD